MKSVPLRVVTSVESGRTRLRGLSESDLDAIAWDFLGSEFTGLAYANWPIERRVGAYLTHHGMTHLRNNGDAHAAVLQRVLANVGTALRNGTLSAATWASSRRQPRAERIAVSG
ncbi:hypothetical protein Mycch_1681 [Mycolicibacterium chubuense NBB4]|uniref:Uncharacterized protein n=1 Tax=Mycolicibacterium chubuense (strain NBB4) TaxID=710421 RepID=I4BGR6_MYCCN|nr:hypothetical protein [Mycolicibacterium chubuense]AFM16473.1 hypothetical protein Mycch_1681 [Mycolicibacterium chubuense NBB4]